MRITATGVIGLGLNPTTTDFKMVIYGTTSRLAFQNASTGTTDADGFFIGNYGVNAYVYNYEAGSLIFGAGNAARMTITSVGNIGIGTSSPSFNLNQISLTINGKCSLSRCGSKCAYISNS